jgi:predicted RNA-binding Zn ribbon-like protein
MNSPSEPTPESLDWTFHFETGRACLDFVATVGDRAHLAFDRWRNPHDLSRWCAEARLLDSAPAIDAKLLNAARALREAVHRTISSLQDGKRPQREDIRAINNWAARPALAPQLIEQGAKAVWISDKPLEAVLSTIARDAISLVTGEDLSRVRECASPTCSVLFLDASRPGKRTWCSMNRCGNRSKKASYRRRHVKH